MNERDDSRKAVLESLSVPMEPDEHRALLHVLIAAHAEMRSLGFARAEKVVESLIFFVDNEAATAFIEDVEAGLRRLDDG